MFEAVEFTEVRGRDEPDERVVGAYPDEIGAVEAVRAERAAFVETGSDDYVWWVVRQPGERLAQFIADSRSDKEFILDLATGQLVEV